MAIRRVDIMEKGKEEELEDQSLVKVYTDGLEVEEKIGVAAVH
jgi:hypothetical protein